LFLSFTFLLNTGKVNAQKVNELSPVIQLDSNTPALYHASFKVLKYKFTGLVVFKYLPATQETRVVFLAEAGLSIAEFSFKNNTVECIRVLPMVDRKAAKKYLTRIIHMVLAESSCTKEKITTKDDITTHICKGKKGKHYYIYKQNSLEQITYKSGLCRKAHGYVSEGSPARKVELLKRKKVQVKLKIVDNAIN